LFAGKLGQGDAAKFETGSLKEGSSALKIMKFDCGIHH
jgi:hypothetical protein